MPTITNKLILLFCILLFACRSSTPVINNDAVNYTKTKRPLIELLASIPNYSGKLYAVKGRAKAIVSKPGNSERVNIDFTSDTAYSILKIKNRLGIEGASMFIDPDSILTYFKTDKIAQKISIHDGRLTSLNQLASINLLDLLHFKVDSAMVIEAYESDEYYFLKMHTDGAIKVNKNNMLIEEITQPYFSKFPYSKIIYEHYGELSGYLLPKKITIFNSEGDSKAILQIRSLKVNPYLLNFNLNIPSSIPIERL